MLIVIENTKKFLPAPYYRATCAELHEACAGRGRIGELLAEGATLFLNCERINKQHNLGDMWAEDRARRTIAGKKFQRLNIPSDLPLIQAAIARGCE